MNQETVKPSHREWMEWGQVVIDRLTTCVHVYSKPPYDDVFIAEKERHEKNDATLSLLRRIHGLIDEGETSIELIGDVAAHDERVIDGLSALFRETLDMLPTLSSDAQKLLKSEWFDKCNGRVASELFRGPMGDLPRGIGSGYAEQGRLPSVLASLLERERIGEDRQPRKDIPTHKVDRYLKAEDESGPQRNTVDVKSRWATKNRRTAGAVE